MTAFTVGIKGVNAMIYPDIKTGITEISAKMNFRRKSGYIFIVLKNGSPVKVSVCQNSYSLQQFSPETGSRGRTDGQATAAHSAFCIAFCIWSEKFLR